MKSKIEVAVNKAGQGSGASALHPAVRRRFDAVAALKGTEPFRLTRAQLFKLYGAKRAKAWLAFRRVIAKLPRI